VSSVVYHCDEHGTQPCRMSCLTCDIADARAERDVWRNDGAAIAAGIIALGEWADRNGIDNENPRCTTCGTRGRFGVPCTVCRVWLLRGTP